MIETLVTILHILTCLALILAILLQSGRWRQRGFWWRCRSSLGQRGATTVLGRFTGIASATFMITSMILAVYSTSEYRDETLRDIPAAEKPTPERGGQGQKGKAASDAKTAARRPVIQQQKIRPQVTSRPQKLMHQKLMHQS